MCVRLKKITLSIGQYHRRGLLPLQLSNGENFPPPGLPELEMVLIQTFSNARIFFSKEKEDFLLGALDKVFFEKKILSYRLENFFKVLYGYSYVNYDSVYASILTARMSARVTQTK